MKVALALAATMLAASVGTAGAGTHPRPQLRLVDRSPLVVRGIGFQAAQRVTLSATSGEQLARRVFFVPLRGTFTARFDGIRLDACTGATIVAIAKSIELGRLKISLRECPGPVLEP